MHHHALTVCLVVLGINWAGAKVIVRVNDITTKGKTFRVICEVQGETFVGWFKKDGTKVTSQNQWEKFHYTVSDTNKYTLVVRNVVVPDGGTYQCRGSDTTKNFTLYVEFYVTDAPKDQAFNASQTANIKCVAAGYTEPVYRWFKNTEEVDHKKDSRYTIMRNGTLQIKPINESDSGEYICRITQLTFLERTREEERQINVIVYAPPRINIEKSSTVLYTYYGNLKKTRLRCFFWGFPIPDIKLLTKGKEIKSVQGTRLIKGTVKTQGKKVAFGNYTCEAVNRFGVGRHIVMVREPAPPTPPRNLTTNAQCDCLTVAWEPPIDTGGFPISLYIQELSLNGTVLTTANVGASPRSYTFTRHLKPNTEYKISLAGETVAKKGKSAEVIVKTSPCPPSGEMFILNEETTINSTNLTVRWTRPPDDGGDKEISYTLEYSRADTQGVYVHWIARKGLTQQHFNAEELTRGSVYLFHVVATNSVGRSRQYARKAFYVTTGAIVPTTAVISKQQVPVDPELVYNMEVNCTSQLIQIVLALKHFPGLDFASFQLIDPSCKPITVTDTQLILSTRLDSCGTTQAQQDQQITYSNKVIARVGNPKSKFYMVEFPFSCRFGKEQLIGTPSFQARRKISTFEAGVGKLAFLMKLFPTPEYKTPYNVSEYPVQVDPRHTLYSQVELIASDPSLVILLDTCTATPSFNRNDPVRYPFIEHGCAVDRTVKYLHQPNRSVQRFTIQPFKFKGKSKPKVYLHCKVLVCHASSRSSKCAKGCVSGTTRKKRLSEKQTMVHCVTLGPVVFPRQITDKRKSIEHSPNSKSPLLVTILVILGVAVLGACVYGVYHRMMTRSSRGVHVRVPSE